MDILVAVIFLVALAAVLYFINSSNNQKVKELEKEIQGEPLVKLGPEPVETTTVASQPVVEQPVVTAPVAEQASTSTVEQAPKKRTRKPAAKPAQKQTAKPAAKSAPAMKAKKTKK